MKKINKTTATNLILLWIAYLFIVQICPLLFITFPFYLLISVGWALEFYKILQSNEYKDYSLMSKLVLMLCCLVMLISASYFAFSSPAFKSFNCINNL